MTPTRANTTLSAIGVPTLLIGFLAGLGAPSISRGEPETTVGNASPVQRGATKGPVAQGGEEARWLAVRYTAEAEHHFFEAIRYEERAIQIDPVTDSRGTSRNKLLSEADSHWTRMFDLRTRAQLSRVEAHQRSIQ